MYRFLIPLVALYGCATAPTELEAVNTSVNHSMVYETDRQQYGRELWVSGCPAKGDCEDFALCKQEKLAAAGYAKSRSVVRVFPLPSGINHAVLVVDGKWVLDNRTPWVAPTSDYDFSKKYDF